MPEPTSEAWAHIRHAYEHTTRPVEDICAEHGISSGTLRDRMRHWHWTRRRPPIPRDGPPPVEPLPVQQFGSTARLTPTPNPSPQGGGEQAEFVAPAFVNSNGSDSSAMVPTPTPPLSEPADSDPASIVQRLQGAVARVLPAIEATIARLAAGPQQPREMEQAGRALGALTRTLRELNALLSQHNARATNAYDDMPEDIDAFRLDLARRIDAFVESRSGEIDEAEPEET